MFLVNNQHNGFRLYYAIYKIYQISSFIDISISLYVYETPNLEPMFYKPTLYLRK